MGANLVGVNSPWGKTGVICCKQPPDSKPSSHKVCYWNRLAQSFHNDVLGMIFGIPVATTGWNLVSMIVSWHSAGNLTVTLQSTVGSISFYCRLYMCIVNHFSAEIVDGKKESPLPCMPIQYCMLIECQGTNTNSCHLVTVSTKCQ